MMKFTGRRIHRTAALLVALMLLFAALPSAFAVCTEAAGADSTEAVQGEVAEASASSESRTIGILFDNSGSMYKHSDWCRALYAMETFAAMANEGDRILIYPMHAITVGVVTDEEIEAGDVTYYTSTSPLEIICGDEEAVAQIRQIYTPEPGETPIESLEEAYESLIQEDGEKWFLVLTDGYEFDRDGVTLSNSKDELSELLSGFQENLNVMYLGIGTIAVEPELTGSEEYVGEVTIAADSAEVLADMIALCNTVYGRSAAELSADTLELTEAYSDVTILVQGTDVSTVTLTDSDGEAAGTQVLSYALSYSTTGQGKTKNYYNSMSSDTDLAGVLVTYENVPAGTYTLSYDESADSIHISYATSAVSESGEESGTEDETGDEKNAGGESQDATEEETQNGSGTIEVTVDGSELASDDSELTDAQSTRDTTPNESSQDSEGSDGLLANGHWIVLGVILALVVFAVIWGVMHQRMFPERIMLEQTYYTVDGEEMAGEATIEGGRDLEGRTAQLVIRAPEVPGRPDLEFGITLEIKPVDYRCMKSFLRRVEIVDITGGSFATSQVKDGSIAASRFVWNEADQCFVNESGTEESAGKRFGYTVGSMRTYRLNGVARDGDREMEVELSFVLQHK